MFHLCVEALAPLDGKMATCQGCRWKELLSTALLGGRAPWETLPHMFLIGELHCCAGTFLQVHNSRQP